MAGKFCQGWATLMCAGISPRAASAWGDPVRIFGTSVTWLRTATSSRSAADQMTDRSAAATKVIYRSFRSREYWMIYRGPGFLAVVWFGSSPTCVSPVALTDGRGGKWVGWGMSPWSHIIYDGENSFNTLWFAWSKFLQGKQKLTMLLSVSWGGSYKDKFYRSLKILSAG